jgi:hypothetical protein
MEVSLNTGGCSNVGITYTLSLYLAEHIGDSLVQGNFHLDSTDSFLCGTPI